MPRNFTSSIDLDKGTVSPEAVKNYNSLRGDQVITPDVAKQFAEKWNQGEVDPRLQNLATKLNRSPQSLLQQQLYANRIQKSTPLSWPEPVSDVSVPMSAVQGAQQFMSMGVPARGAAWLAGNIQHESGWKAQRPQWDLGWDGAGTNGGLLSWNRGRLSALEARFGRKSTEISAPEQMTFLLEELKKYPKAYRTFMNPLSSDRQLIDASKAYIGYNDTQISQEGRYATSRSLARQLQR
jgi:hypothetical protein